jgi:hypothetical protein
MSLTEYADLINELEAQASQQAAALVIAAEELRDLTPQDVQAGLERARPIRMDIKEATDDIEPPELIADLHHRIFDWHTKFISIEEALAARAGAAADTAAGWSELSDSSEMAAYRAAISAGKQVCDDLQAELDATSERGVFDDTPWIPSRLTESVTAVVGCAWFPDNPEDVYRYPPVS